MPQSYLEASDQIAREAGAVLSDYLDRNIGFELKGEFDLVTAADRASEKLVIERLTKLFPDHAIVAEEGGHAPTGVGFSQLTASRPLSLVVQSLSGR